MSIARVHRETQSLRLLCERFGVELDDLDRDSIEGLLAELELSEYGLSTINEYKKALKYFLEFNGKTDLSRLIRRKEPKDNRLTRDDLLSIDEVMRLVNSAMNDRDPALIMCHLDLGCRPEELLTLTVGDFFNEDSGHFIFDFFSKRI